MMFQPSQAEFPFHANVIDERSIRRSCELEEEVGELERFLAKMQRHGADGFSNSSPCRINEVDFMSSMEEDSGDSGGRLNFTRGEFYEVYTSKREARLEEMRGVKEAEMKAMFDSFEDILAEMKLKFGTTYSTYRSQISGNQGKLDSKKSFSGNLVRSIHKPTDSRKENTRPPTAGSMNFTKSKSTNQGASAYSNINPHRSLSMKRTTITSSGGFLDAKPHTFSSNSGGTHRRSQSCANEAMMDSPKSRRERKKWGHVQDPVVVFASSHQPYLQPEKSSRGLMKLLKLSRKTS